MRLIDIDGRETFVVYYWLKNSVTIVGVASSEEEAQKMRKSYIDSHPDPDWEKASGERRNNTLFEKHYINVRIPGPEET